MSAAHLWDVSAPCPDGQTRWYIVAATSKADAESVVRMDRKDALSVSAFKRGRFQIGRIVRTPAPKKERVRPYKPSTRPISGITLKVLASLCEFGRYGNNCGWMNVSDSATTKSLEVLVARGFAEKVAWNEYRPTEAGRAENKARGGDVQ